MKIQYSQFTLDPSLRGKTVHLPAHVAAVLIATNQAVEVKLPPRGAPGWAEARMEESRVLAGTGDASQDTVVANVYPPTWTLETLPITCKPAIVYRSGSNVTKFPALFWYDAKGKKHDAIPSECPKNIRKQFEEQLDAIAPERMEAAAEKIRKAQTDQDASDRTGTNRFFGRLGIGLPQNTD